MEWSPEAEDAVGKVPFFVRKKVRKKIERYVQARGLNRVTLEDTQAARKQFLATMSKEIKGYQVDRCFGTSGCPHGANDCGKVLERAEVLLQSEKILDFLKQHVKGDLKYHHEFRLSTADCPNACSQPQIKDFGIIGAVKPKINNAPCIGCEACVHACPDDCITLEAGVFNMNHIDAKEIVKTIRPTIDTAACLMCGKCVDVCPTGTIQEVQRGFRVMLGGRLGRHPRIALSLHRIYSEDEVIAILKRVLDFYKKKSKGGERFAKIFDKKDIANIQIR